MTRLAYGATAAAMWLVGVRHDAPLWGTALTSTVALWLALRALPRDGDEQGVAP